MGTIAQEIKALTEQYKQTSIQCMNSLCDMVGVNYYEPKDVHLLLKELEQKGMKAHGIKFSNPLGVGQYIVFTDLENQLICGYKIWISFSNYVVDYKEVDSEEWVSFFDKGMVH